MAKAPMQLTTRHQFVQVAKPKTVTAKAGAAIVQAVDALTDRHDGAALRDALLDFFSARETQFKPAELEAFFSCLIQVLPRKGPAAELLEWAYQSLVRIAFNRKDYKRAIEFYKQYLGDCAPRCDAYFDQTYFAGLVSTASRLTPLARRMRFFLLAQLFQRTQSLPGLVAECGCFRGLSSYLLCSYMKAADPAFNGRGYRIFDSFAGLSEPKAEDAIDDTADNAVRLQRMTRPGAFAASLEEVKRNLAEYPGIEYHQGWIPESFPDEPQARYRFVHIDVDLYQPTLDSLEYFYPKLVPGGYIVSDDYSWPGARKAVEAFVVSNRLKLRTTPTGQAYFKKGR